MHINQISMPERVARFMAGWSNISLSGRALAFSLLLAVLAGVISGFAPALEALTHQSGGSTQVRLAGVVGSAAAES